MTLISRPLLGNKTVTMKYLSFSGVNYWIFVLLYLMPLASTISHTLQYMTKQNIFFQPTTVISRLKNNGHVYSYLTELSQVS